MKHRYADMTWPECKAAADSGRVAVISVGTYEDHGYHLPIDVDVRLATIKNRAGRRERPVLPSDSHW